MEPYSEARNPSQSRINTHRSFGFKEESPNARETRFPRTSDLERQTQELRALKLYAMNNEFRQMMFSGQ